MYEDMIEEERMARMRKAKKRAMYRSEMRDRDSGGYSHIGHARDIAREQDHSQSKMELKKELDEIKAILSSTKKDIAKYKCPLGADNNRKDRPITNPKIHNVRAKRKLEHLTEAIQSEEPMAMKPVPKVAKPSPVATKQVEMSKEVVAQV
jgi:hypothetical protein